MSFAESEVKRMKGLEIGDRVEVLRNGNGIDAGTKGTIIEISDYIIGVELDEYEGGHSCGGKGKKGHCRCINSEFLRKIEEKEVEKMSDLKIGDRVRIIYDPKFTEFAGEKSIIGMTGTAKDLKETCAGVEFDEDIGGHSGSWNGKPGYCWYIQYKHLEKIEETEEETKEEVNEDTKADTLEQKILEVLREEIGVKVGEAFDVCGKGEKQWTCKFEKNGFTHKMKDKFLESGLWKSIVGDFHGYQFKRKSFMPEYGEDYFFLAVEYDESKGINFRVLQRTWIENSIDYGMLAVGNIFRTEEEALKRRDELLERLEKLRNGE